MILLRPIRNTSPHVSVDDSMIVASNPALGSAYADYDPGENYGLGATCYSPITHNEYESLAAGNQGNNPDDRVANKDKWLKLGKSNLHRLFDRRTTQLCENPGEISVTLRPGTIVDSLSFFGADASVIEIQVDDPVDGVVYEHQVQTIAPLSKTGFFSWLFEPIQRQRKVIVSGMPPYSTADIRITLKKPAGTVRCGEIVLGRAFDLGDAEWDADIGTDDYSLIEYDDFGVAEYEPGNFNDYMRVTARLPTDRAEAIKDALAEERGRPVVIAAERTGKYGTLIYGLPNQPRIKLRNAKNSKMSMEIKGLG